jgi:hypothetical protein
MREPTLLGAHKSNSAIADFGVRPKGVIPCGNGQHIGRVVTVERKAQDSYLYF